jgi:hypothetical protein
MKDILSEHLPTPLAYLLSRYDYGGTPSVVSQLRLFEATLMFIEHLLRAQTQCALDLAKPAPLGARVARIRELRNRLDRDAVEPIVNISADFNDQVSRLLSMRNTWIHGSPRYEGAELMDRRQVEHDMSEILKTLVDVQILLNPLQPTTSDVFYELNGVRGLFEPTLVRSEKRPSDLAPGALLGCRPKVSPIVLHPFIRWRQGSSGENRVELLSTARKAEFVYFDPIGESPERTVESGHRDGEDLQVTALIPEAYQVMLPIADEVIQFVLQSPQTVKLTMKARTLVHDLLRAALFDDEAAFVVPLFVFFTQVETFLRKNQARFLSALGVDPKDAYVTAGISNAPERMTFGELLRVYSTAPLISVITDSFQEEDWTSIIQLRNEVSHGRCSVRQWRESVTTTIDNYQRIDRLLTLVSNLTSERVPMSYWS